MRNFIITEYKMEFNIKAPFEPAGDQPEAIAKLTNGIENGARTQVLIGATGTGKTYTIAQVINKVRKPTLVIAHNKTLAAQLASEFKAFFPENAVEYFVSYYDYYQPEAYIPQTDTYIEKDASINDEIDKLRHSATSALFERRDVIVVASVSCIYGLGAPQDYYDMVLSLRVGQQIDHSVKHGKTASDKGDAAATPVPTAPLNPLTTDLALAVDVLPVSSAPLAIERCDVGTCTTVASPHSTGCQTDDVIISNAS